MTSNPRKQEMDCWNHLHNLLEKLRKNDLRMEYKELVLQCICKYPVGKKQVENHIKEFYIDRDIFEMQDHLIAPVNPLKKDKTKAENDFENELSHLGVQQ